MSAQDRSAAYTSRRRKVDDLNLIIRMNGPLYRRIRANCCDVHGLGPEGLDRHAATITLTVATVQARKQP